MATIIGYVVIGVAILLAASWGYGQWKSYTGSSGSAGADSAFAFVDQVSFLTAIVPVYLLARKRGDDKMLALLRQCREQAATWDDDDDVVISAATAKVKTVGGETVEVPVT